VAAALAGSMLTACATAPGKIGATYVSPMLYSDLDCRQIRFEMMRVGGRVQEVTGTQQSKANNDAVAMGVGLVLFWPALFFLANGADQKAELAALKGKYEALEQIALEKRCGMGGEASAPVVAAASSASPTTARTPSLTPADGPTTAVSSQDRRPVLRTIGGDPDALKRTR